MMDKKNNLYHPLRESEAIEELSGERGKDKKKGAIRLEDVRELLMLSPTLQSSQVSNNPTAADYNKLQADLTNIHQVLSSLSASIQKRII